MIINFRQVEVFLAVARFESFSAAAKHLRIAQSAVSITVRRLEETLGTRLFHRSSRTVELTSAGHAYLTRVRPALAQLALAADEARATENGLCGVIQLAAPAIVTQYVLAKPLVSFQVEKSGIQIKLRQGGATEIEDWVLAGDSEIGVVAGGEISAELAVEELVRLSNALCVSSASPLARLRTVTWPELLRQPLVTFPVGYHQRRLIDTQARKHGFARHIAMESESVAVLLEAVRQGVGVATLPGPAVLDAKDITALPLEEDDVLSVVACHRRDYPLSRAGKLLLDHVKRTLGNRVRSDNKRG